MAIVRTIKSISTLFLLLGTAACTGGTAIVPPVAKAVDNPSTQSNGGLLAVASDLSEKGQHEAAIPLYRYIAATSQNDAAVVGLANSLLAMGDVDGAFTLMDGLVNRAGSPSTVTAYYVYGKSALALGKFRVALGAFTGALNADPHDAGARSGMAIALAATGKGAAALAILEGMDDATSLSNKALVLAATGEADAAIRLLEPIVASGNAGARERQNLAMAYLLAGQDARAYEIARLDLDPISVNDTFTFYRSLSSLEQAQRMQALVTGVVEPTWSSEQMANLKLDTSTDRIVAAQRVIEPEKALVQVAAKPAEIQNVTYEEGDVPPLLEPEGWALQIGAYRSISRLVRGWNLLRDRNIDILRDIPPRRSEVDFGSRDAGPSGFYYRLNAGPLASFSEAKTLCNELKRRGTRCWIRPPEASEGTLPTQKLVTR